MIDGRRLTRGQVAGTLVLAAAGVLLVATAYALARAGLARTELPFWAGQGLILLPAVQLLLRRPVASPGLVTAVVLGVATALYVVKVLYSPDGFRFPDELQHLRGTLDVLDVQALYTPNPALPVSSSFPALQAVTGAFAQLSGLPVFASGLVVGYVAHLGFTGLLLLVTLRLLGSARLAGLACLLYATNPHFAFFDSMVIYQTLALPFMALAVWSAQRTGRGRPGGTELVAGLVGVAGVAVAHHVTSYLTVALLLVLALRDAVTRSGWWSSALAGASLLAVGLWTSTAGSVVTTYFGPQLSVILAGLRTLPSGLGERAPQPESPRGPLLETAVLGGGVLLTAGLAVAGGYLLWRGRSHRWSRLWALGALGFFGLVGVRLVVPSGAELAGRLSTFVYVPVAAAAAVALTAWVSWRSPARVALATGAAALLLGVGVIGGWPPRWERLPGRYQPAAFESSVEPQGLAAARWARDSLPRGGRIAADLTGYTLLSTIGAQSAVRDTAPVFTEPEAALWLREGMAQLQVEYVSVDRRLARGLPASGAYFPEADPGPPPARPLSLRALAKFDRVPEASRLLDTGDIQVYDVRAAWR